MVKSLAFGSLVLLCAAGAVAYSAESDQVAYGKYLVEEIARCGDCHTQRLETGQLDQSKWLEGATLDFAPIHEVKGWHATSPDLTPAGRLWQRWGEAGLIKFLQTATGPTGHAADPPMPPYKLKAAEAEAVVAYLKSLK